MNGVSNMSFDNFIMPFFIFGAIGIVYKIYGFLFKKGGSQVLGFSIFLLGMALFAMAELFFPESAYGLVYTLSVLLILAGLGVAVYTEYWKRKTPEAEDEEDEYPVLETVDFVSFLLATMGFLSAFVLLLTRM